MDEQVYLGDFYSALVVGKGKFLLELTFGKSLVLNNALHVPSIRYNLVSMFMLGMTNVKVSFKGYKVVITMGGTSIENEYSSNELFKINVLDISMNKNVSSAYIVESFNLWHDRLGHLNYLYLRNMKRVGLLFNICVDNHINVMYAWKKNS